MLDKFGRTLLFLFFVLLFILGAKMAIKVGGPAITRLSASLADAVKSA